MISLVTRGGIAALFGAVLSVGVATPSLAISDWIFPSDAEMRQIIGLRTDRYKVPSHNVMESTNGFRHTKCAPRYARRALSVGAWSYNLMNGPYGGHVNITTWKYPGRGAAFNAVNTYRRQMSHCRNYRLYIKRVKKGRGFPVKTSGVTGGLGQVRMRNKYGDVVDSAEREWMTAVDEYAVQVEAVYWGRPRPPFPPPMFNREVTDWMKDRLLTEGQAAITSPGIATGAG